MVKPKDFSLINCSNRGVKQSNFDKSKLINKKVYGFDSETYEGKVTLLAAYNPDDISYVIVEKWEEVISFLLQKKFRNSLNFFFNLRYDMNAIIKTLPYCFYDTLRLSDVYIDNNYFVKIAGNKCLEIGKHTFDIEYKNKYLNKISSIPCYAKSKFFDIFVFYQIGSLETTYKKVFKKEYKKRMLADKGFSLVEIKSDKDIINYCIEDAKACYELAENLVNITNNVLPIKNYYSPASLAKEFINTNINKIYNSDRYIFEPNKLNQYAFNAYQGGRFEIIKKGFFKNVYSYDINSAYPYCYTQLYGLNGKVKEIKNKDEIDYNAEHGFYHIEVNINEEIISPLKYFLKNDNLLVYPNGYLDVWLSIDELNIIKDKYDFKLIEGIELIGDNSHPMSFLSDLYDLRKKLKNEGNPLELYYKLVLNSIYGVFMQLIPTRILISYDKLTLHDIYYYAGIPVPKHIKSCGNLSHIKLNDLNDEFPYLNEINEIIKELHLKYETINKDNMLNFIFTKYSTGKYFNPIWGTEITAKTRNMLLLASKNHEADIISFATDSITSTKKLNHIPVSDKLGEWKDKKINKAYILACGIYAHDELEKVRGLKRHEKIFNILERLHEREYEFINIRPIGLRENIQNFLKTENKTHYDLFNLFMPNKKYLKVDMDKKRQWINEPNYFNELMNNQYDSIPLRIEPK